MGLNLIRRGPETIRLTVTPGDGRVNTNGPNGLYILQGWNSWVFVTVTATGVTGISVQDRENGYDREDRTGSGPVMSYSGVFYADKFGPTVAVFDPTEDTEVIMHVVPIPPPCFVGFVWGGCRGPEESSAPGGHRTGRRLARPQSGRRGGAANQRARRVRHGNVARRVHPGRANVRVGVREVHNVVIHAPRRGDNQWGSHLAGLHRPGVRHRHLPHHVAQEVGC